MIYLQLFYEFFIIGLFSVGGGGMATIPFLYKLAEKTGWFQAKFVTDMVVVSESTPGPIGINMATYVGFSVAGVAGGIIATLGVIAPAMIIVTLLSKTIEKYQRSPIIKDGFYAVRPAVVGIIGAGFCQVLSNVMFNVSLYEQTRMLRDLITKKEVIVFLIFFVVMRKFKLPIFCYICLAAVAGIVFQL